MKVKLNDKVSDDTPPEIKRKRKHKIKISQEEGTVIKKQEKRNKLDLSINNGYVKQCAQEVNGEASKEFHGNIQVKKSELIKSNKNYNEDKEEVENEENTNEQVEQFNGKSLRASFNSPNGLDMLKTFVKVCKEDEERDFAAEYLNAGGSIFEILKFLDIEQRKNIGTITSVFSAVRILLIKILAQYPQYQSSAVGACRHIMNSHLPVIHSMLSLQSNAKQRKVVLQLLAALVSLGGTLPRELLAHLSLPLEVIKSLVKHTKPAYNQNTRNCFIHFILAFLIEGKVSIIRALLDKHNLLTSIFSDLTFDSKDIITLVLTTFKSCILKNVKVSKTMKLHVFSTPVIQNLVRLYNWKGPTNWEKSKTADITLNPQFLEEKEVVTEVVHDFLITLLTSYRYGIIFHDRTLGMSRAKHNQIVNTILQSLERPWEYEKPSNLVVKIIAACPDLVKSQFILLEPHIEPRVSIKWIAAMKFVQKIIESGDAETKLKECQLELNESQLANAIMSLTLPEIILKHAIMPSLTHCNVIVRHEAILVLTTMFDQLQKYLSVIKTDYNKDIDFSTFKNYVTELMIKNVPNLNMILKVWNSAFVPISIEDNVAEKEHIPKPKKHEHVTAILNLLHVYNEIFPQSLHTFSDLQATEFLSTLNELDGTDIAEFNAIKIKAIQFLVVSNPIEFSPQKEIFSNVLSFLISVLNEEVTSTSLCAKTTIKTLLNISGMFEGCTDQLDVWVNGFINLDERNDVINWFVNIIKKAAKNIKKYVNEIIETEESINEGIADAGRLEDTFNELVDKDPIYESLEKNVLYMQQFTSISPLLCCILHKMKKNLHPTICSYVSYVLVHILHYQVAPQCLIHLAKDVQGLPARKYLLSWLEEKHPISVKKVFPSITVMSNINAALLGDSEIQLNEIFSGDKILTFKYNSMDITVNYSLSAYEIMYLFKMTVFYFTQLTKRGILTKIQNDNCKILLISLLHFAKECADNSSLMEKCAKSIFTHPTILYYFSPFNQKNKGAIESMIALTVADLCKVIIDLHEKYNIRNLFFHFKNKLLVQLCNMIAKHEKGDNVNDVETIITLLDVLQLTSQDVVNLLKNLVKLKSSMFSSKVERNLSIYGRIIPKLLDIVSSDGMQHARNVFFELDAECVKSLCSHLLVLKSNCITDSDKWEIALCGYLSKFPFNIAGIDTNIFLSLLSVKITDATVRLISFLISKNRKFIPIFIECMIKSENIRKSNIIFTILVNNLKYKWNRQFLQNLKIHYEKEIVTYLSNPSGKIIWIEENVNAVSYLIKNTFDFKTCSETCNIILQIGDKLDMVSIQYIQILQSLYNKCATFDKDSVKFIMNLIQVLLHIITLTLKKESKNITKLNILCEGLNDAVKHLREKKGDFVFEALSGNHSWLQFTRFSLKLGLKGMKADKQQIPILKTLSILCNVAYKNDSDNEYAKTLFEMATSHSEFINIMLDSSNAKRDLIELLWILMQKNKTVIALTQVPVYLAAYNATLSEVDQYILSILQYYESNNINIYEYRPYLWGNAAAIHYSVKGETHMALWRQPSANQVLNLFEEDIVNNTIQNYPVDRALKNNEVYKTNNAYDPAFYLPLLCFLLSENNVISCQKIAQSGALALAFTACSSNHSDVRMAAYTVIARYYTHLEASSSKAKLLWMRLIDALRYGVASVHSEVNDVRLNCLVSTFLARTSLIATQPLNPLYLPLQTFLMAKPALDINTIPELLHLFHSSDVEHKAHRHWILEIIRDGIKTESDLDVAFKCVLFKMLLDFYTCNLSDPNTKKLILEVIDSTLKIDNSPVFLIEGYGLVPWLLNVSRNMNSHGSRYTELLVNIMDKLLNTILNTKGDIHYKLMLLNVALNLKLDLFKDTKITTFTLYVNILQKLLLSKSVRLLVTKERVMEILTFSKRLVGNMDECEDMLRCGCEYVTKADDFKDDDEIEVARDCLRTLVWTWCSHEIR